MAGRRERRTRPCDVNRGEEGEGGRRKEMEG